MHILYIYVHRHISIFITTLYILLYDTVERVCLLVFAMSECVCVYMCVCACLYIYICIYICIIGTQTDRQAEREREWTWLTNLISDACIHVFIHVYTASVGMQWETDSAAARIVRSAYAAVYVCVCARLWMYLPVCYWSLKFGDSKATQPDYCKGELSYFHCLRARHLEPLVHAQPRKLRSEQPLLQCRLCLVASLCD